MNLIQIISAKKPKPRDIRKLLPKVHILQYKNFKNNSSFYSYAYLPFGQGPRGCIGMRFALLEIKLAIANIVRNFTLFPSDKTTEPLELDPVSGVAWVKNGLYIRVEKRD